MFILCFDRFERGDGIVRGFTRPVDTLSYRPICGNSSVLTTPPTVGIAMLDFDEPPFLVAVAPTDEGIPSTGTIDDDDEPEDESEDENEAPIRETSDATEAPEEFEKDDEDRE
jgi:hypothetical protein